MTLLDRLRAVFRPPTANTNAGLIEDGEALWWNNRGSNFITDTTSGEVVSDANLLTSTTCFACTKLLSEAVAGLPSSIVRQLKKRRRENVDSHPAQDILCEMPNPEMNSFTFWELAVTRTVNTGNFYAEIQRDGRDRPVALWPIHPSRVKPIRMQDGSLYWEITGDYTGMAEYQDPSWRIAHNVQLIPNRDMLNIVGFGSLNGVVGPGIAPGAAEIGVELAARRYGARFYGNGGMPLGFVEHPGFINDPTKRNQLRADLNDVRNLQQSIGVLWDNAKFHSIGITPEQAQMLESRRYTGEQICSLYGVAPPLIGHLRDSKYANAGEAVRGFVMLTLRSLVERIERAANTQVMKVRVPNRLVSAFDDKTIFRMTLDGLLRGDPKMQAETWEKYRMMGVATTNDVLRDLDMNEIDTPEGEYRIVHSGTVRLDKIDQQGSQKVAEPKEETAYNRDFLIEGLAQNAEVPKVMVQGSNIVESAIKTVTEAAIDRINEITATQIERWREKDPKEVQAKLADFFAKQVDRLREALAPADHMAASLDRNSVSGAIVPEYRKIVESLDSHTVFDERLSQPKDQLWNCY